MALKINSASGSITLTAEDGSGNANVTLPRGGIVSDLSDLSITATATELNYVDGVTSNIQTQLDAKGTVSSLSDLSITATAADLNTTAVTTLGTVEASKVVTANANGDVTFPDGEKALFGSGSDLQIYHDGSNSYIYESGTGGLALKTDGPSIYTLGADGADFMWVANSNGSVDLYHDGSKKIETTSTGVNVTGTAEVDTLQFSDGSTQTSAGASTGKAIAMAIVFG